MEPESMTVNLNIIHPQQLCCVCPEGVLGRHHILSTVAFFPSVSDNSNANHMQCCIVMLIWDIMDTSYWTWGWKGQGLSVDLSHGPLLLACRARSTSGAALRFELPSVPALILNIVSVCTLTYAFYVHILFNFTMNCPGKVIKIYLF